MTQTAINGELKRINDKIKHLETVMVTTAKTGSLGMLERSRQIREEILREFSIIQKERDNTVAALKDNLKDHLAPYKNEDIQKIREEKIQLVTAAEFKAVHRQMLEQTSDLEKKLATAVKALGDINDCTWHSKNRGIVVDTSDKGTVNLFDFTEKVLAEIGGEDD